MKTAVTCPFCSLLCDDLSAQVTAAGIKLSDNACAQAIQGFSAPPPPTRARLKGKPVSIKQAAAAAGRILRRAKRPLIAGLETDIDGLRAALRLGEKTSATLLPTHEWNARHIPGLLRTRSGFMTTLAELKNRADTVIFVGNNVTARHERFIERLIKPAHTLFLGKNPARQLIWLGRPSRREREQLARPPVVVDGKDAALLNNLALLRHAMLSGTRATHTGTKAAGNKRIAAVAQLLRAANYGVFVWSAATLPADHADLIIDALMALVWELNQQQRFAGLSLDSSSGVSYRNVATWQTGCHVGIRFRNGYVSAAMTPQASLAEADGLLWISGLADTPAPALDVPKVVLAADASRADDADVYIPTGVPGVDHTGNLFRTDGVINLPLKQVRANRSHSAAEVLSLISERLT